MASDALIAWINGAEAEFVPSSRALPPSSWSTLLDGSIVFQLAAVLFEGTLADGNVSSCTTPRAKFAAVVSCLEELMGGSYDGLRCVLCEAVAGEAEGESEALPATAARSAALEQLVKLLLVAGISASEGEIQQELVDNMQQELSRQEQSILMPIIQAELQRANGEESESEGEESDEAPDSEDADGAEGDGSAEVDAARSDARTPTKAKRRSLVIDPSSPLAPLSRCAKRCTPSRRSLLASPPHAAFDGNDVVADAAAAAPASTQRRSAPRDAVAPLSATERQRDGDGESTGNAALAVLRESLEERVDEVARLKEKIKAQSCALRENDEVAAERERAIYLSFLSESGCGSGEGDAAAYAAMSILSLKGAADERRAAAARELNDLRTDKSGTEDSVRAMGDELECLRSSGRELTKANKKIEKLQLKLEKRKAVQEEYENLQEEFTAAQAELKHKSIELQKVTGLTQKLNSYKSQLTEQNMKLRELERLRAENSRLRDDAGILQDNEDRAMAMAAESEDRAAVLADELAAGGESLGDMACARGVTELNPQVAKKLTALETRNAELSALVSLGSVEHVRDIEAKLETEQATRSSFETELLVVEERERALLKKLRGAHAEIVALKCAVAAEVSAGAEASGAAAARRALGALRGAVADNAAAALRAELARTTQSRDETQCQLEGELESHAALRAASTAREAELSASLADAEERRAFESEQAGIDMIDAQSMHAGEIHAMEAVIEQRKQQATEERRRLEAQHERTRAEHAAATMTSEREIAVMSRQLSMCKRRNRELQEETIKLEEQLAMYGKGCGEDKSEVERLRREAVKAREENKKLRREVETLSGGGVANGGAGGIAGGGVSALGQGASRRGLGRHGGDEEDVERGYESALREMGFENKKLKAEKETLEMFRASELGKRRKLESDLREARKSSGDLEAQVRKLTLAAYRAQKERNAAQRAIAAASPSRSPARSPSRSPARSPYSTPADSPASTASSVRTPRAGRMSAASYLVHSLHASSERPARTAQRSGAKLSARRKVALSSTATSSAENSPHLRNRAALAAKGRGLATTPQRVADEQPTECAQQ